ncbi:FecR family protein [Pseudomonas sp. 5P_3.1_Bac2]|uniref:FecR family protein n=1 Tax=Pseudomonas sp. 5P_3.1_Bac2 TaxID=2971617 RepID=UPI0021C8A3D0|nr:FecR family protein [Pseudomonas sp. 5P_3.1_Bac2]MCU1717789.1 FecR family protein [Pseudomonas sp. 5P_3.1_Bac2]
MNSVSARVLDAAIEWQLCLDSGTASAAEREAFNQWLCAHPEHSRVWQQLNGVDLRLACAATAPARQALLHNARQQGQRRIGTVLGFVFSAGLVLALFNQYRELGDYFSNEYTAYGEQRQLRLSDQTQVRLNSASAVDIEFDAEERRLYLRSGEILVETAHGDSRPFIVRTAQGRLQALGTRFLVRREGDATRLIVLQSAVAATPAQSAEQQVINQGQQVLMQRQQLGRIQTAAPGAEAWSKGMLVADNLPLAELLDQLGQYQQGYLGVDPQVANLRISGSFPLYDTDKALAALPASLPVRIQRVGSWWQRVVPALAQK